MGLGALGGGRLFAAPPGWTPPKGANLVFGVVSDTHLRTTYGPSGRPGRRWPHTYFAAALSESKAKGRPCFYMQHTRPLWDVRKLLRHLCRGCVPVSFFGHNHWSASSWDVISLYKGGVPCIQVPSCEPRGCSGLVGDAWITQAKIERTNQVCKGRQGYVVRVYDDLADGNPKCRVYAYEVEIAGSAGVLRKAVYAAGCNLGMGHEPHGGVTTLQVGRAELPKGEKLVFTAIPLTSVGTRGNAING